MTEVKAADSAITYTTLDTLVRERWSGQRLRLGRQHGRQWDIPSPTGGTFNLHVILRPRWCDLFIERWHTTPRDREVAAPWLEEHVWPVIEAALKVKRTGFGVKPAGSPVTAAAGPIERPHLVRILTDWVDQELTWGVPREGEAV